MAKPFFETNKQAPTRRQIDDYVAARNRDFEAKIKNLNENITFIKSEIENLIKQEKNITQRTQDKNFTPKGLIDLKTELETFKESLLEAEVALSVEEVELQSRYTESSKIDSKIVDVEKTLAELENRFFKKQERDECTVQLSELKNKKELVESQKLIYSSSRDSVNRLISNLKKQIDLQSKTIRDVKTLQNLQVKISANENLLRRKEKLLIDLETEVNEAQSLEEPLLSIMAVKHALRQRQISERKKKEAIKKVEKKKKEREDELRAERRKQQAETQALVLRLRRLENFVDDNSLTQLEKELSAAESVVQRLEKKEVSLQGSIDRWVKSKFRGEYWGRKSPKQILGELKRGAQLKYYLPLWNLVAKKDELTVSIQQKQALVSEIKQRVQKVNDCIAQIAEINGELSRLEKDAMSHIGRHRQPLPRMDIENWSDAELFAEKYMKWLGFADAKRTGAGADEGKDVDSRKAIAQVKDMGTGASRPMLQQLNGVAAAERKIPIFFARSYATTAKEWGEKHGIALFQFTLRGEVKAVSKKAKELLEGV